MNRFYRTKTKVKGWFRDRSLDAFTSDVLTWCDFIIEQPPEFIFEELASIREQLEMMEGHTPVFCYAALRRWFHSQRVMRSG